MPRQKKNKQAWEIGLQGSVSAGRRGWSVSEHNGRTRLRLQFPKTGDWPANAQTNLPFPWDKRSTNEIVLLINRIYEPVMSQEKTLHQAIGDELALSDNKADEVITPWSGIVEAFRDNRLNLGNRIKPETYEASYGRYLQVALLHLQGRKPARTGKELVERVLTHERFNQKAGVKQGEELKPWIEMSASRQECCLALKLFLEFAVSEHRQPQALLIPERDYLQLRGAGAKRRQKAVLTDDEVMELTRQLSEPWANVVKVARVFGVRTWEFEFILRRTNEEGNPQLWVRKGKTYNKSGGVKEETEPRWLHAIPVNGQTFDLLEKWDELEWPPTISGKSLGAKLRLIPYWQELKAKYEAQGEWLRPYSFRDTFSVRSHDLEIETTLVCAAMGHSMEVHRRSYRTHEAKTIRKAYERASENRQASRSKRQQQSAELEQLV